ncbi:MAG: dihydroneopterin triphosphate diphosphatase [Gammaproteobacteria bacterium]|nr:dihydroneopterin triphosphate diphosphatase [Gammaproteobacteria bacterium]
MTQFKRPESVLIVVCTGDQRVLLMQRLQPEGFWQSVTGSLEENETAQETAQRELFEETGLSDVDVIDSGIQNIYPIHAGWRHRYDEKIQYNKETVFIARLSAECEIQFSADEHREYRWLEKQQAVELCSSVSNARAIEMLV